ncbi:unnamed protein product [Rotaria socialis]|uniref:Uncharacterized protein n=1 Tax=Rotaria socialis TaxID=392032 RepID=A0A821MDZ4_9BILA|nr:unnamed protein product [Rotaria socialis]
MIKRINKPKVINAKRSAPSKLPSRVCRTGVSVQRLCRGQLSVLIPLQVNSIQPIIPRNKVSPVQNERQAELLLRRALPPPAQRLQQQVQLVEQQVSDFHVYQTFTENNSPPILFDIAQRFEKMIFRQPRDNLRKYNRKSTHTID